MLWSWVLLTTIETLVKTEVGTRDWGMTDRPDHASVRRNVNFGLEKQLKMGMVKPGTCIRGIPARRPRGHCVKL